MEPGEQQLMRRGWKIGAEDFRDWLADKLARRGRKGERASERRETDAALAERMVREALAKARWREVDLASRPRGHHVKVKIAQQLRRRTPMRRQWIADRLRIGSPAMSQIYSPVSIVSSDPYCDPGFLEIVSDVAD